MDIKLTESIRTYLDTAPQSRDVSEGALMLLRLSGNRIMYRNICVNPTRHADFVEYQLRKYYNLRVAAVTHQEVEHMQKVADVILAEHCQEETPEKSKRGKRNDHDALPEDIQQLYIDNLEILHRMRDVQTHLRLMMKDPHTCPDSDRYPYLKELIALDKKMHENWDIYDHYIIGKGVANPTNVVKEQAKIAKRLNLLAGKYAKNPTPEQKETICELYAELLNPSEKLTAKLTALKVLANEAGE